MAATRARKPIVFDDGYLPLDELATYSGLSRRKLEEYLNDPVHPLPHYRFDSKIAVRRSEFDAWAEQHHHVVKESVDIAAMVEAKISGH
jgi:hypothetical protein